MVETSGLTFRWGQRQVLAATDNRRREDPWPHKTPCLFEEPPHRPITRGPEKRRSSPAPLLPQSSHSCCGANCASSTS